MEIEYFYRGRIQIFFYRVLVGSFTRTCLPRAKCEKSTVLIRNMVHDARCARSFSGLHHAVNAEVQEVSASELSSVLETLHSHIPGEGNILDFRHLRMPLRIEALYAYTMKIFRATCSVSPKLC